MSYGRDPYYIYGDFKDLYFTFADGHTIKVPEDAIAQFVLHMVEHGELEDWIGRGREVESRLRSLGYILYRILHSGFQVFVDPDGFWEVNELYKFRDQLMQ